jgi:APA family basic amino acid/polyamine antiporter
VPYRAEVAVGGVVAAVAALGDIRSAIGFSSFAVLLYYAIANAATWTLGPEQRRWPRALAALGLVGCLALATSLPAASVIGGAALLVSGALVHAVRRRRARTATPS